MYRLYMFLCVGLTGLVREREIERAREREIVVAVQRVRKSERGGE